MITFLEKDLKSLYHLGDYDEIDDLDTKKFTNNLDNLKFVDSEHSFIHYLGGFFHNLVDISIFHSYYNKDTLTLKIYCEKLDYLIRVGIWVAWNKFNNTDNEDKTLNVEIYDRYCGELYKDDFHWDEKEFYKWFVSKYISINL